MNQNIPMKHCKLSQIQHFLLQKFHLRPSPTKDAWEPITATFNLHLATMTTVSNGALLGATVVDLLFPVVNATLKSATA